MFEKHHLQIPKCISNKFCSMTFDVLYKISKTLEPNSRNINILEQNLKTFVINVLKSCRQINIACRTLIFMLIFLKLRWLVKCSQRKRTDLYRMSE